MDQEFHRLHAVCCRKSGVLDAGSVVCDGGDAAACRSAISGKIDGARGWRGVFGVDEAGALVVSDCQRQGGSRLGGASLVRSAELSSLSIAVIVRPTGNRCHGHILPQYASNIRLCLLSQVIVRNCSHSRMANNAPSISAGEREEEGHHQSDR